MKTGELTQRQDRAERETFVIAKTAEGYRVCSALTPANQYIVFNSGDDMVCSCPDFQRHAGDPEWRCKHILAVLNHQGNGTGGKTAEVPAPAVAPNPTVQPRQTSAVHEAETQMLLKRSVSPDGRIDSLSVEFACPVSHATAHEIRQQAQETLKLQSEIVSGFLKGNGKPANAVPPASNGSVPAQVLGVAGMDTRFGRRLFLNVLVNGQVCKLFGAPQQLAEALTNAGCAVAVQQVTEGAEFNVPCRVATKPSADGKYINVERILPSAGAKG